jgi:hypothetical protein
MPFHFPIDCHSSRTLLGQYFLEAKRNQFAALSKVTSPSKSYVTACSDQHQRAGGILNRDNRLMLALEFRCPRQRQKKRAMGADVLFYDLNLGFAQVPRISPVRAHRWPVNQITNSGLR